MGKLQQRCNLIILNKIKERMEKTEQDRWDDAFFGLAADVGSGLVKFQSESYEQRLSALSSYKYRIKSGYKPMIFF